MPDEAPHPLSIRRFVPLALLVLAGALFFTLKGRQYLSLTALAEHHDSLCQFVTNGGAAAALAFIVAYAGLVALSVPASALLTMTSGFLFGAWIGTLYALVGATVGATVVFLAARAGLAGLVERAGPRVRRLEAGFREDALSYLFVLRLVPVFPFWLVNLAAGAVGMRLRVYVLATFFGMAPTSFIYASLGNGLGEVLAQGRNPDFAVLFRPSVLLPILGLAALALLPVLYKRWRSKALAKAHR